MDGLVASCDATICLITDDFKPTDGTRVKLWRDQTKHRHAAERTLLRAIVVAPAVMGFVIGADALAQRPEGARPRRMPPVAPATAAPVPQYLASGGATFFQNQSQDHFETARRLYFTGAFASAEASAWLALESAALEISRRAPSHPMGDPVKALDQARTAMNEAQDFAGRFGSIDADAISRMVRSHRTPTLKSVNLARLSAIDAADAYLDHARIHLATLSSQNAVAARSMDLLAAVLLSRDNPRSLPSASALALRRAALQGQPGNAPLARRLGEHLREVGLRVESERVFAHAAAANRFRPDAPAPLMQVETLSPEAFAATSRPNPMVSPTRNATPVSTPVSTTHTGGTSILAQTASHRMTRRTGRVPDFVTDHGNRTGNDQRSRPSAAYSTDGSPANTGFWSRITPSFLRGGDQ